MTILELAGQTAIKPLILIHLLKKLNIPAKNVLYELTKTDENKLNKFIKLNNKYIHFSNTLKKHQLGRTYLIANNLNFKSEAGLILENTNQLFEKASFFNKNPLTLIKSLEKKELIKSKKLEKAKKVDTTIKSFSIEAGEKYPNLHFKNKNNKVVKTYDFNEYETILFEVDYKSGKILNWNDVKKQITKKEKKAE